jgi:hypothetical protein
VGWDCTHLVRRPLIDLLNHLKMMYDDKCGAVGGMRIGRVNRSTRRKPAPVPLCPPQIPHDLTCAWTLAASVGSRRLTAWAMARPSSWCYKNLLSKNLFWVVWPRSVTSEICLRLWSLDILVSFCVFGFETWLFDFRRRNNKGSSGNPLTLNVCTEWAQIIF